MKVFLSWSGQTSRAVAEALHRWLPSVIQFAEPWMSAEDISKGMRWSSVVARKLMETSFGIICVTRDNVGAPWLLFEAGALSKTIDNTFVCPYLVGVEPNELKGPLAQFQAAKADREDTKRLLYAINSANKRSLPEKRIDEVFNALWPRLQKLLHTTRSTPEARPNNGTDNNELLGEILSRVRDLSPRPAIKFYFLISFDRLSGIGAYEFEGETRTFQVGFKPRKVHMSSFTLKGQVETGFFFDSLDELIAFCTREYLKDKKDAYYGVLFTKRLQADLCIETLRFLNKPRLRSITMSRVIVSMLKEVADADRVASIVLQAHRLRLVNVMTCLTNELREIVLSKPVLKALKDALPEAATVVATLRSIESKGLLP